LNEHKHIRDIYIRTAVYILLPPLNVRAKWILCTVQPVLTEAGYNRVLYIGENFHRLEILT